MVYEDQQVNSDHGKAKSPKKFTQPQLMSCLVIKESLQLDYRGTHTLLSESCSDGLENQRETRWGTLHFVGLMPGRAVRLLCSNRPDTPVASERDVL